MSNVNSSSDKENNLIPLCINFLNQPINPNVNLQLKPIEHSRGLTVYGFGLMMSLCLTEFELFINHYGISDEKDYQIAKQYIKSYGRKAVFDYTIEKFTQQLSLPLYNLRAVGIFSRKIIQNEKLIIDGLLTKNIELIQNAEQADYIRQLTSP